jgi:hypothetical protein
VRVTGARPWRWTDSNGCFDRLPGVLILELRRAELSQSRMQACFIVDLVDEPQKIDGNGRDDAPVAHSRHHQTPAIPICTESQRADSFAENVPHRFRELLDGDPAFTKGGVASEALNGHRNRHGSALPWKVSQPAIVSAVDAV